mgnify:CR=1 FL=1
MIGRCGLADGLFEHPATGQPPETDGTIETDEGSRFLELRTLNFKPCLFRVAHASRFDRSTSVEKHRAAVPAVEHIVGVSGHLFAWDTRHGRSTDAKPEPGRKKSSLSWSPSKRVVPFLPLALATHTITFLV